MAKIRKSYTVEYKEAIVKESRGKNLADFCKKKNLDLRMVRKWRSKYEKIELLVASGHSKNRKCGPVGRKPIDTEMEDFIYEWILERRAMSLVVRRADIQKCALAVAPSFDLPPDKFKASDKWLRNFMSRHELSLRRSTTLFKLEDEVVVSRAISYKNFIDRINFSNYKLFHMIAMDETAVFMGEGSQSTVDLRGASSIYVPSTGYESGRVTCILAIRLDGTKAVPLLIAKGKKDSIEKISGVYIIYSAKAWATQEVIRRWIDIILPPISRGNDRALLIWDSASTHRAKDMKDYLSQKKIDQVMIPAGMTGYLQTLDIAINKPFKDSLRLEINDYIEKRMVRNERGNFVKPGLSEVASWVRKSWEKISDDTVANALRAGYLDKNHPFKETSIAKHERLGPLILQELESHENPAVCQDLEIDDVPEEDDLSVFE